MICNWCGDAHPVEALCARAQRGLTRRSFLFLSTAAVVGAALPSWPFPAPPVQMFLHHGGPNIGKIVAEEWNRAIGRMVDDNLFNFRLTLREGLRQRLLEDK